MTKLLTHTRMIIKGKERYKGYRGIEDILNELFQSFKLWKSYLRNPTRPLSHYPTIPL